MLGGSIATAVAGINKLAVNRATADVAAAAARKGLAARPISGVESSVVADVVKQPDGPGSERNDGRQQQVLGVFDDLAYWRREHPRRDESGREQAGDRYPDARPGGTERGGGVVRRSVQPVPGSGADHRGGRREN